MSEMNTMDEQLKTVLKYVENKQLGQALASLENYLLTYFYPQEHEQQVRLQEDYHRMMDYWQRGFQDDRREVVYLQLLQRLYRLTTDLTIVSKLRQSPFAANVQKRVSSVRKDWSITALRSELESFVSGQALLELTPQNKRVVEEQQLYDRHQALLVDLFDYIWTLPTWSESFAEAFIDLLLTPTIDTIDQQLLVSAVTLSLQNYFDFEKERVLMEVYLRTTNQRVRQRALVGWVLSLDSCYAGLYPEMNNLLQQLVADEECRQELKELQIQMVYCMTAEEDSRKAQQEMFSEILKNNDQFKVTRNGIEEIEDNSLEDILHPEASEQRIEKMEAAVNKMLDMQRAGSDIYFSGFAQTKRFPFFNDTCNWFIPFFAKHPALRQVMGEKRRSHVLLSLLSRSPFCDSDSYSFALAFVQSIEHLPKKMQELWDSGELAVLGEQLDSEAREEPVFIRRAYLQDLYRFYRLFPSRSVFSGPFDSFGLRPFFFANPLFSKSPLALKDFIDVAAFLAKHREYKAAFEILKNCEERELDERYYLTYAAVVKHVDSVANVDDQLKYCYSKVLASKPDNEQALQGMGRIMFNETAYETALDIFNQLLRLRPEDHRYLLNKAVCLGRMQQYEEALQILFKMSYEQPDNTTISSTLAWTLVGANKLEQADKIYKQLMQQPEMSPNDLMNSGFCQWLMGNITAASELFKRYNASGKDRKADASFREEAKLLQRHGISDVEIRLMVDLIRDRNK